MRILEVSARIPTDYAVGGGETYFRDFVKALEKSKASFKLDILTIETPTREVKRALETDFNITLRLYRKLIPLNHYKIHSNTSRYSHIENIFVADNTFYLFEPVTTKLNPFINIFSLKNLIQYIITQNKYDIIHFHNLRTWFNAFLILMWPKFYKTKFVLTDHNARAFPFPDILLPKIDKFLFISYTNKKFLNNRTLFYKIKDKDLDIIYTPVNEIFINKKNTKINFQAKKWTFTYVGRVEKFKNIDGFIKDLIEVIRRDSDISKFLKDKKTFIGGSPTSPSYANKIKKLVSSSKELNVDLNLRSLGPRQVKDFFEKSYFSIFWSKNDTFSIVILEAILSGNIPIFWEHFSAIEDWYKILGTKLLNQIIIRNKSKVDDFKRIIKLIKQPLKYQNLWQQLYKKILPIVYQWQDSEFIYKKLKNAK